MQLPKYKVVRMVSGSNPNPTDPPKVYDLYHVIGIHDHPTYAMVSVKGEGATWAVHLTQEVSDSQAIEYWEERSRRDKQALDLARIEIRTLKARLKEVSDSKLPKKGYHDVDEYYQE